MTPIRLNYNNCGECRFDHHVSEKTCGSYGGGCVSKSTTVFSPRMCKFCSGARENKELIGKYFCLLFCVVVSGNDIRDCFINNINLKPEY